MLMDVNTKYNEIVRKLNEYDPIFEELNDNDIVTMADVESIQQHYENYIKPRLTNN
jgi:hypothetical protein